LWDLNITVVAKAEACLQVTRHAHWVPAQIHQRETDKKQVNNATNKILERIKGKSKKETKL